MTSSRFVRRLMLTLCLSMIAAVVSAQVQPEGKEYQPVERQQGKDVVWLPTAQALVDKMLDMAKVTSQDYVIDLGSGDGRTVITAAKRGARALGIEFNPDMVVLSKRNAAREGVSDKARFIQGDLFNTDFSQATVLTLFLLPEINYQLRPKILEMKPGTRIVSNSFDMSDWIADQTDTVEDKEKCPEYCTVLLWIVPAKVEGAWKLPQGQLILEQNFQMISGRLNSGPETVLVKDGRLSGDEIKFAAGGLQYIGRVSGNTMQGTVKSGERSAEWRATRVSKAAQAPSK
jgi:SAM-dependent methyltransferase